MRKIAEPVAKLQIAVGGVFLAIFLLTVVIQIFTRYLGIAATWTGEISTYSFIWSVFMGAAVMVFEKRHFAFTSVSDSLKSGKAKSILNIVIFILMLVFCVLMIKYGWNIAAKFWNYTWDDPALKSFKKGPLYLCIPICGITSAFYLVCNIIDELTSLSKGGKK